LRTEIEDVRRVQVRESIAAAWASRRTAHRRANATIEGAR
jgi:hypothetical protein